MKNKQKLYDEIATYIYDCLEDFEGVEIDELHNEMFNTDYYIIYANEAKEWLEAFGTFDCIGFVKEYENENFGEVNTEIDDPVKVAYIVGEEILSEVLNFEKRFLDKKTIKDIEETLKDNYNIKE